MGLVQYNGNMFQVYFHPLLSISAPQPCIHPENPHAILAVSNPERRHFSSWQGNQGFAGRRTVGTPHKKSRRLTQPGRKRTLSGWKLTYIPGGRNLPEY